MKLLFVLPRFPYPILQGDRLRAWRQLRALSALGHEIHLLTFADDRDYARHLPEVLHWCSSVEALHRPSWRHWAAALGGLFNDLPFQVNYYRSAELRRRMAQLHARHGFDLCYVQLARMGETVAHGLPMRYVLDYMDAFSARLRKRAEREGGLRGWLIEQEARRMERYEARIAARYDALSIISQADAALLPEAVRQSGRPLHVWPNGVGAEFFELKRSPTPDIDLIFTGNMSYHPNIAAATCLVKEVVPLLEKRGLRPSVYLVGTKPASSVQALADERVKVTGFVPDVRDYLARAQVFVAPLFLGSGLQNKLLEAMAAGLPVVTTPLANAALQAPAGDCLLTGSNPNELAEATARLLNDPKEAAQVGEAGRAFVRARFDWDSIAQEMEAAFAGLAGE